MSLKKNIYYILIVLLFINLSCVKNKEINSEVNNWVGKQLTLPKDSLIRNYIKKKTNPLKKKIKILTVINGDCSICYDELKAWKSYIKETDTSQVGFVFIIYTFNKLMEFNDMNNSTLKFQYPYFQDDGEKIVKENNFPDNRLLKTFLLDSENKVILIGNPTIHKSINDLYKKEIKKRIK
ncbi:redoxin domain-containing protein [Flavivirga eckloniae]|uniref:Uncharacterized protein n=1 Tax=Flavivirga eckloniae TaxID=1803846 RepID=A0A2K9PNN1_9FLAO|nr:redoxin domain-containing protein [Flavivirga eckloniae]AUP78669.1 hypothetical protein C1H87_08090 [Flavivirga eckloniae]